MPLKAVIAGCGKIGWSFQDDPGADRFGICTHAAAWSAIEGVQLVGVADAFQSNASACAARWDVPSAFSTLEAMLAACTPDIVSIATPDHLHFEGIKECLAFPSVRAVLAEKPLAATAAEAEALASLATSAGKHLVVNYSRRFCPFYAKLRTRIQAGEFGELRVARGLYTKGVRHNGSHFLDLMRWFFGELTPRSALHPAWLPMNLEECDPGLDASFMTASGASVVMHHLPASQFTVFEMDLCFERARFICTDGGDTVQEFTLVKDKPFAGYTSLELSATHSNVLRDYLLHAAQSVTNILQSGAENRSPAEDSSALLRSYDHLSTLIA